MQDFYTYTDEDSVKDGYPQFESSLQVFFDKAIDSGQPLFKTRVEDLFELYLASLPEDARQHYNCHACRHFINRHGSLVTIDADGNVHSAIWNPNSVPTFFKPVVKTLKREVESAEVVTVFIPEERKLGTPKTGEWTHLHLDLPQSMIKRSVLRNAHQLMAEKKEDFRTLSRSVNEFSIDDVNQVLALIQSETLYRGDRLKPIAEWFKNLLLKVENTKNTTQKKNVIWSEVAVQSAAFTHIRSSMIGTLLEDIKAGLSGRVIAARYAEKMNPSNFMRSQSAPTANTIAQAEKVVQQLGIADSLERRYARIEEVPLKVWEPKPISKPVEDKPAGVFGHLVPDKETSSVMDLPTKTMTWEKFQRTVLPTAESIEALVDNPSRFMALVTASNPDSENILQWDNPFSWYYHGGIDGEIKRRVEEFGGRHENNIIRTSLIWEGRTDLDLHCITPRGSHIYYSEKTASCGGYLDLDMNGLDKKSDKPVENMRWATLAPEGRYKFYVHNYSERVNSNGTPFRVELEIEGKTYHFDGEPLRGNRQITVFEFDYQRGQEPRFISRPSREGSAWGETNAFKKVNGITTSPNLWGENTAPQAGTHIFFLLDDVQDNTEGEGRGFFTEMLKPELREIRKTLEAYTGSTPIQGAEEASACGIGYVKDREWNLTLKVTANGAVQNIKIDRWD